MIAENLADAHLLFPAASDIKVERSLLTDQGLPIVCLSNGHSYTYRIELGTW